MPDQRYDTLLHKSVANSRDAVDTRSAVVASVVAIAATFAVRGVATGDGGR